MADRLLLRDTEAAERLNVSRATVWRMARAGQLPTVKVRNATRFPSDAVERIASSGTGITP